LKGHYSQNNAKIQRRYVTNYLLPYFGDKRLDRINDIDIENWVDYLDDVKDLTNVSINHRVQALKTMLKEAVRRKVIRENPATGIPKLPYDGKKKGILNDDEVVRIFSSQDLWIDQQTFTANYLAAITGMRLGELLGLQSDSIKEDYILVKNALEPGGFGLKGTKTEDSRPVPIPAAVRIQLLELRMKNP